MGEASRAKRARGLGAIGPTDLSRLPCSLIDLKSPGECSYDENRAELSAGAEFADLQVDDLSSWVVDVISGLEPPEDRELRIGLDVSSLTRNRIARLIEGLRQREGDPAHRAIRVDVMYTPARWAEPAPERHLIEVLGPVTPYFAGFGPDPDTPAIAFVGLGIEQDRAIGALEYLEPAAVWAFLPRGEDEAFDSALHSANHLVWDIVPVERQISYRVDDPFGLFITLEQLVFSEVNAARPILVPLGPKIFAACALLVAAAHQAAGVWRVTPGRFAPPHDCESNEKLVRLGLRFTSD
jgi:hypothetical protein